MIPKTSTVSNKILPEVLCAYISLVKAMQAWFHAAHHVTKGSCFAGDHELIYGDIYATINQDLDGIIEKSIGLTQDEMIACPIKIMSGALEIIESWSHPNNQSAEAIAKQALEIELEFVDLTEAMFEVLEGSGDLSLGLNNFLSGLADKHESFIYKLNQRSK